MSSTPCPAGDSRHNPTVGSSSGQEPPSARLRPSSRRPALSIENAAAKRQVALSGTVGHRQGNDNQKGRAAVFVLQGGWRIVECVRVLAPVATDLPQVSVAAVSDRTLAHGRRLHAIRVGRGGASPSGENAPGRATVRYMAAARRSGGFPSVPRAAAAFTCERVSMHRSGLGVYG